MQIPSVGLGRSLSATGRIFWYFALLSIVVAPTAVTMLIVVLAKPDGPLNASSNTTFWVLAAAGTATAVAGGSMILGWFFRTVLAWYLSSQALLAVEDYPELFDEDLEEWEWDVDDELGDG